VGRCRAVRRDRPVLDVGPGRPRLGCAIQFNGWLEIDDTGLDTQALAQLVKAVLTVGKGVRS
jgi:hypothetical protein